MGSRAVLQQVQSLLVRLKLARSLKVVDNEALLFLGRDYLFDYLPVTFVYLVARLLICSLVLGFTR